MCTSERVVRWRADRGVLRPLVHPSWTRAFRLSAAGTPAVSCSVKKRLESVGGIPLVECGSFPLVLQADLPPLSPPCTPLPMGKAARRCSLPVPPHPSPTSCQNGGLGGWERGVSSPRQGKTIPQRLLACGVPAFGSVKEYDFNMHANTHTPTHTHASARARLHAYLHTHRDTHTHTHTAVKC